MTREEAIKQIRIVLENLKSNLNGQALEKDTNEAFETLIPELKESEDERIRKEIIDIVTSYRSNCVYEGNHHFDECLSWLEKQKEQKPNFDTHWENGSMVCEQKPIRWTDLTWEDINELEGIINNVHYEFRNGIGQESFGKEVLEKFRSTKGIEYLDEAEQKYWREEEQKPEDVTSIIYNAISEVCHTGDPKGFAEINQTVFKVAQRVAEMCQKPEWSEEDKKILNEIITIMDGGKVTSGTYLSEYAAWLKSLPERFNLQPKQEWSEKEKDKEKGE